MLENSFIIFAPENSDNMSEYKQIKYDKILKRKVLRWENNTLHSLMRIIL